MNIATTAPSARSHARADDYVLARLVRRIHADVRAMDEGGAAREAGTERIRQRIEGYFRVVDQSPRQASALLTALLGTPINEHDVLAVRASHQADTDDALKHVVFLAVNYGRQTALEPDALAHAATPEQRPSRPARPPRPAGPPPVAPKPSFATASSRAAQIALGRQDAAASSRANRPTRVAVLSEQSAQLPRASSQASTAPHAPVPAAPRSESTTSAQTSRPTQEPARQYASNNPFSLAAIAARQQAQATRAAHDRAAQSARLARADNVVAASIEPFALPVSAVPQGAPPPYSFDAHHQGASEAASELSMASLNAALENDLAIARAMQEMEDADYALAVQLQSEEDGPQASAASSPVRVAGAASLATEARLIDGVWVPAALINPSTQATFKNPLFDTTTGRTVDGPGDGHAALPAGHVADYALRDVLEAWARYHDQDEAQLAQALQDALTCSITQELFTTPVIAADGSTYEQAGIRQWLATNSKSPKTRQSMTAAQLWPARTITALMREYGMMPEASEASEAHDADFEVALAQQATDSAAPAAMQLAVPEQLSLDIQAVLPQMRRGHRNIPSRYQSVMHLCASPHALDRMMGRVQLKSLIKSLYELVAIFEGRRTQSLFQTWLSDCHRAKEEYGSAILVLRQALEAWPPEDEMRARLAFLYAITGQMQESQTYAAMVRSAEGHSFVCAARGEIHRRKGEFRQALQKFADADAGEVKLREVAAWRNLARKRQRA